LLADDRGLATAEMEHWSDHPLGAAPLNYVAMLRCDNAAGVWRDVVRTGPVARALLDAGAPVNGNPGESETPLMTAASYGEAEVAQVLVEAGADLEAVSSADAGGVPNATALRHAAVFGMTAVVDVLVAAGARVEHLGMAAAAGDISAHLRPDSPLDDRVRALMMAADHQRLDVIDELVAAGTPVDVVDETWGRHPLRLAAENGWPGSVRRLLAHGADPDLRDAKGRTPLDLCRAARPGHANTAGPRRGGGDPRPADQRSNGTPRSHRNGRTAMTGRSAGIGTGRGQSRPASAALPMASTRLRAPSLCSADCR